MFCTCVQLILVLLEEFGAPTRGGWENGYVSALCCNTYYCPLSCRFLGQFPVVVICGMECRLQVSTFTLHAFVYFSL
uniref:Secreted protein n=1 Tax=Rhizophora mucronata TaxID=61149 RepID=A0A2P2NH94_RHIMU